MNPDSLLDDVVENLGGDDAVEVDGVVYVLSAGDHVDDLVVEDR